VNANGPFSTEFRADIPNRHGITESQTESMLRESVLLAAAFTGTMAALVLQDESGFWYRDSSGLNGEQMAALETALSLGFTEESGTRLRQEHGLQVIGTFPLMDIHKRVVGTLCLLSSTPLKLSAAQLEGIRLLSDHIRTILTADHHKAETRTTPRAPSAASFVPGLVHELGSFIFGISANLDAFEARFADMEDVSKYGANIRRSLDRMSAFIVELREYGDPQRFSWSTCEFDPLLREAIEHHKPAAAAKQVELQLHVTTPLPALNADEPSLQAALTRVVDLVLQQEEKGGRVILNVATASQGERVVICGSLDCSSLKFKDVDPARLFEPFYFRVSGLGRLTLPGARRVFESHGGTLTAGPGPEGSIRITFMLPSVLNHPLRSANQT
jgi:signal transduction histidine kinase